MNRVICKPIGAQQLRANIAELLDAAGGAPLVDRALLQDHCESLGAGPVQELYREAISVIRERAVCLRDSGQDAKLAESEAHAIAGLCSNYGLPRLGLLCSDIETCSAAADYAALAALCEEVPGLVDATVAEITARVASAST